MSGELLFTNSKWMPHIHLGPQSSPIQTSVGKIQSSCPIFGNLLMEHDIIMSKSYVKMPFIGVWLNYDEHQRHPCNGIL